MTSRSIDPLKFYNGEYKYYHGYVKHISDSHSDAGFNYLLYNISVAAEHTEDTGDDSPDNMTITYRDGVVEYWNTGHIIFNMRNGGTFDIPYMHSASCMYDNALHRMEHAYRIILTEL